jgi:hypothetical protein
MIMIHSRSLEVSQMLVLKRGYFEFASKLSDRREHEIRLGRFLGMERTGTGSPSTEMQAQPPCLFLRRYLLIVGERGNQIEHSSPELIYYSLPHDICNHNPPTLHLQCV